MATPINAPMASEIWHLSIEDLFQPVTEAQRLGGDGPFVINLSASTAPINTPAKTFDGCRDAHIYQIQVTEDGRTRYRLRLGPFAKEDQADAVLAEVRETYPGALTATAAASDLRVIASMQPKAEAQASEVQSRAQALTKEYAEVEAEISIDISLPSTELVVPPGLSPGVAPGVTLTVAPKTDSPPAAVLPVELAPEWALPKRDIAAPRSAAASQTAKAPTPTAAPKAAAPVITPVPIAADAPVLTVTTKSNSATVASPAAVAPKAAAVAVMTPPTAASQPAKAPSPTAVPKAAGPVITPVPIAADAPVLTESVTPKSNSATVASPAAVAPKATAVATMTAPRAAAASQPVTAPSPTAAPKAAGPVITLVPIVVDAPVLTESVTLKPKSATAASQARPAVAQKAAAVAAMTAPASAAPIKPATPQVAAVAAAPVRAASAAAQPRAVTPKVKSVAKTSIFAQAIASALRSPETKPRPDVKAPASQPASLRQVVVATAPAPAPREVKKLDKPLESLEFTQTVRALTAKELESIDSSRWFVIQLALADRAFDPDAVPNLDIFSEYRLYSVAGIDQGRVVHALRLGFFREEIGAVAVASYLAEYWSKPSIKRVSVAERERFANQKVEARKDVGATGTHAIIEITDELVVPRKRTPHQHVPAAKSPNQPSRS